MTADFGRQRGSLLPTPIRSSWHAAREPPPHPDKAELLNKWQIEERQKQEAARKAARK